MVYIRPDQQKKLVAIDVKTKVNEAVTTVFLAVTIVVGSAVALSAILTFIRSWLVAE